MEVPDRRAEPTSGSLVPALIRSLRPKQWAKNALVFAAPVAANVIDEREALARTLVAFVCFCGAASATYLLNDARDVESDRRHPTKRHRPIAAGLVPLSVAYPLSAALLVASVVAAFITATDFGWVLVSYVVLTTAYSFGLKHVAIVDIVAVAAGFVLRAVGGAAAAGVPISEWFFIVTSFGALLVVTGKRSGEALELADHAAELRPTLRTYTPRFLIELRAVFLGGVLIAYCLWAFSSAELDPSGAVWFQVSIVPFGVAVLRYAMLLEQGGGSEPENLLLSDRMLLAAGTVWAIIYLCAVYAT